MRPENKCLSSFTLREQVLKCICSVPGVYLPNQYKCDTDSCHVRNTRQYTADTKLYSLYYIQSTLYTIFNSSHYIHPINKLMGCTTLTRKVNSIGSRPFPIKLHHQPKSTHLRFPTLHCRNFCTNYEFKKIDVGCPHSSEHTVNKSSLRNESVSKNPACGRHQIS